MKYLSRLNLNLLRKPTVLASTVRYAAWNFDWKPGPYPKTQEERDAAAKKYGLHPKDYKPYPDDGTGFGDYPMIDPVAEESRSPFEHYDFPELKRNSGEIIHINADIYMGERVDINKKFEMSYPKMVTIYLSIIGFFFITYYITEKYKPVKPLMLQQFASDGKKHYTFEKLD